MSWEAAEIAGEEPLSVCLSWEGLGPVVPLTLGGLGGFGCAWKNLPLANARELPVPREELGSRRRIRTCREGSRGCVDLGQSQGLNSSLESHTVLRLSCPPPLVSCFISQKTWISGW